MTWSQGEGCGIYSWSQGLHVKSWHPLLGSLQVTSTAQRHYIHYKLV